MSCGIFNDIEFVEIGSQVLKIHWHFNRRERKEGAEVAEFYFFSRTFSSFNRSTTRLLIMCSLIISSTSLTSTPT
ncbi:MAG: hypothetical protein IPP64_15340 [Bacteroidetes bacterium]|nr:hypothetical protein [Bacteroidota bacterium]